MSSIKRTCWILAVILVSTVAASTAKAAALPPTPAVATPAEPNPPAGAPVDPSADDSSLGQPSDTPSDPTRSRATVKVTVRLAERRCGPRRHRRCRRTTRVEVTVTGARSVSVSLVIRDA